jgi:hypothetical protein
MFNCSSPRDYMTLIRPAYKNIQYFWTHVTSVYQGFASRTRASEPRKGPGYEVANLITLLQPRPRPLLRWLWQLSLAGLVNFRLAFGNYRNGHLPRKGL